LGSPVRIGDSKRSLYSPLGIRTHRWLKPPSH
jgi:hypothetical protein